MFVHFLEGGHNITKLATEKQQACMEGWLGDQAIIFNLKIKVDVKIPYTRDLREGRIGLCVPCDHSKYSVLVEFWVSVGLRMF